MKDTFYFPHDYNARGDEKIERLLMKMGAEGYGYYWLIVEKLYEANGRLEKSYDGLSFSLHGDKEKIRAVVEDFELFYESNGKIASRSVDRRLKDRREKSKKARASAMRLHSVRSTDAQHNGCESSARNKGKERKEIKTARPPLAVDKSVDNSDLLETRMPRWCKEYPGVAVINVPVDYCTWALKNVPRISEMTKKALEARIKIKKDEAVGMSKVARL